MTKSYNRISESERNSDDYWNYLSEIAENEYKIDLDDENNRPMIQRTEEDGGGYSMFISEFSFFDKKSRKQCKISKFAKIIRSTMKELFPDMTVLVEPRRYLVISQDKFTRWQARKMSNELFKVSSLARWHGYSGKTKRLVKRANELELSNSTIKKLYHIIEEEEQNE